MCSDTRHPLKRRQQPRRLTRMHREEMSGLPGTRPSQIVAYLAFLPFPIVMTYTLVAHSIPSYRHSKCFSFVEFLTHPASASIPGIARTVRQLEAAGLPDRAAEVGHYLALMWILSGIAMVTALLWQWLTWTDGNYAWQMAAIRRNWERTSEPRRSFLMIVWSIMFPVLMVAAPFIGGASRTGRDAHNFAGNQFEFFMGIWWIGGSGWLFFFMPWFLIFFLTLRHHRRGSCADLTR